MRRAQHHVGHLGAGAIDALAEDCAQEALSAVVQRLHDFRGDSRFTTWAYAFAVNMALVAARRERWATVSLDRILDKSEPLSTTPSEDSGEPDPERRARRSSCSLGGAGKVPHACATHSQEHRVNRSSLERLLRLIAHTEDEEISCSECFGLLPIYVDLELAGETPDAKVPRFRQHLDQCGVCREEYETLRELIRLEPEGP